MATYPATAHIIRPLSPITELTTPASSRSISLPVVDREYDYQDESPVAQRGHADDDRHGDGDSIYSQGSSSTVVPNAESSTRRSNTPPQDDVPISPPANIRPFPTPSGGLPPPPRSSLSVRSAVSPVSPGLAYLQETDPAISSPISPDAQTHPVDQVERDEEIDGMSIASVTSAGIAGVGAHVRATAPGPASRPSSIHVPDEYKPADMIGRISASYHPSLVNIPVIPSPHGSPRSRPTSIRNLQQAKRPDPPIRIASAHPSLVNIPIMDSPVSSPRVRPNSIHGTSLVSLSGPTTTEQQPRQDLSMRIASNHSLVNIPFLPSPSPTPVPLSAKKSPVARRPSPLKSSSPTRSRPSSPKSRPSTLKKRPNSLHASRPGSWHSGKPIDSPDVTIKAKKSKGKGKRSSVLIEEEGGGSSNDTHSDVSAGVRSRRSSRIPSILLSLFEPSSAKQSQSTSTINSPKTSQGGHSPRSPVGLHPEGDTTDEIKGDAPPLEVVRTSGTFGIQDDGSVHLLNDEPRPMTPMSALTGRPQRKRRDSDNGTVKSAPLGPVLYMGNPDPRQSIDEGDDHEESEESRYQTPRSLTPFEPENPTSPLESVLNSTSPLERVPVERRSVDGAHMLQVIPGRSDVSERAQSPSTRRNSETNSRASRVVQGPVMVDHWTQTSPASSLSTSLRSKRPLPRPPSGQPGSPEMGSSSTHQDPWAGSSRFNDRARPTSMPPPPSASAYAQPYAPHSPTSDLPLLIASHLLSNHASALMMHSTGLAEGAEMMKRMADESMRWGAVLLNMASGQSGGMPVSMPMSMPMPMPPKSWSTDVQPPTDGLPASNTRRRQRSATTDRATLSSASRTPLDPMYSTRPFPSSRDEYPQPSNEAKSDRYTPIPPRMARRTPSHQNMYTEFYDEVNHHGRKGWEELHQAEDIWVKGMKDLREYLDTVPEESDRRKSGPRGQDDEQYRQSQRFSESENTASYRDSRRSAKTTSVVRTDESFLPSSLDLLPSPEADTQTGTDDSFRPQSFDLMTPPNPIPVDNRDRESTVRARDYGRQRQQQPFSADTDIMNDERALQPITANAAISKGYESDQFHPHPAVYPILRPQTSKQSDQLRQRPKISTFDLTTPPPLFSHTVPHQMEKSSTGSITGTGTGGRKLKKRTSALHLQLDPQTPSEGKEGRQPSTAGTTKSNGTGRATGRGKKHWWSRKREGTGSTVDDRDHDHDHDWKGSLTTA